MRPAILALVLTAFASGPAFADLGADCLDALSRKDGGTAKRLANMILFSNTSLPPERVASAQKCLKEVTGEDYSYTGSIGKFETAERAEASRREREAAAVKQAELKAQAETRRKAEAEQAAEAAKKAADTAATLEKFNAEMERRKADREARVLDHLSQACHTMWKRDPDATITNKLCFDVFWNDGLPD